MILSELEKITKKVKPVAQKYNLLYVWVFGSYDRRRGPIKRRPHEWCGP